ncbi:hypothetical protein CTA2_11361 [Colletotrichum tanaceti]|uniref:Uncharacterized protein n=1 Tax=Colletotrichum tanaceti TaxID=1306861 RepID=A0A4V6DHM8_9PEZI|nr:hypothetical protein CTA2_11374 [Colletotrichum tanaceti]KAJ0168003.1 hypothetical protein CTA2_11361 [Colletotrichum tanaceti]TKW57216.1 hypothetical protein CTA1_2233 [Colletotrichum tanaceti]
MVNYVDVGYAKLVNTSISPYLGEHGQVFNAEAWRPNAFACQNHEARYLAELRYRDGVQLHEMKSRQLLGPVVNTTFRGHVPAVDGTEDNTTATQEENYVPPSDTLNFLSVVWASKADEQTGIRDSGLRPREDYMYPCHRERAAVKFD